ncbi:hypothetical protein OAQ08_02340 [Alphaproteobacteria bacterium]|nr:hypothetical protein [Alphaproteobacteria bacterium]
MPSLDINIAGRPLRIQCSDDNINIVKDLALKISGLIDNEKRESVPFLTSVIIAFLKYTEENTNKEMILKDSLNNKLLYENTISKIQEENLYLKKIIDAIINKLDSELTIE